MKIVLDLRIYGPRPGGLGRYNQKLLEGLVKIDKTNQYILIFKDQPEDLPVLPNNFNVKLVNCHWYTWKEQLVLPYVLSQLKADLVHFPHFNVPVFYRGKFVLTIHDLIMTKYPSRHASQHTSIIFALKYWLYNLVIKSAIFRASRIIAVSKFGAADIVQYFKLDSEQAQKVKVVYEGVTAPHVLETSAVKLPDNFFLYVGNAYPHKNLEFLLRVFSQFLQQHPEYYLILVGNKNYFYQRLAGQTEKLLGPWKERVVFAGYVPDNLLGAYYRKARAYIFPSLYEGFGLPPLEAMSLGTPVIASQSSCLPEVLGEAALYFHPQDESALLLQLESIISDHTIVEKLKQAGYRQIKKYSWDQMAQEILEVYNS